MAKTEPFNNYLAEYEQWFVDNKYVYFSELEAIKTCIPNAGKGIEVGIGSGLFAGKLGIKEGCDPSTKMRKAALKRGLKVIECTAENLPYKNESLDFILMVTTICFVDNPQKSLKEINRVLKSQGEVIIAFVDKNSPIGKIYQKEKESNIFYRDAIFYSTDEINELLWKNNFKIEKTVQTVFGMLEDIKEIQKPLNGYGKGSFIVIKAYKL